MNRNKKRRNRPNAEPQSHKIIRCKTASRPVFEHDTCAQFNAKSAANDQKICKNCRNAY